MKEKDLLSDKNSSKKNFKGKITFTPTSFHIVDMNDGKEKTRNKEKGKGARMEHSRWKKIKKTLKDMAGDSNSNS